MRSLSRKLYFPKRLVIASRKDPAMNAARHPRRSKMTVEWFWKKPDVEIINALVVGLAYK